MSGAERDAYSRMVLETERLLPYHGENIADVYKCTLVGCLFETSHHRIYIRHIRRIHPNATNIQCNFGLICVNTFKSYELLKQHIYCAHKKKRDVSGLTKIPGPVLSQCPGLKCLGKQFQNLRDLMLHQRNFHAQNNEMVHCIFQNCTSKYNNAGSLKTITT